MSMKGKSSTAALAFGLAVLSGPTRAVEVDAPVVAPVPELAPSMAVTGVSLTAVSVIPAVSVPSVGNIPMLAAPAALGIPAGPTSSELEAAAPAAPVQAAPAQAAAAAENPGHAPTAAAGKGATVLAAVQDHVAALARPNAQPGREMSGLYDGGRGANAASIESSQEPAARMAIMNSKMATLSDAIALATKAHAGQKDKAGAPYMGHITRVMSRMTTDEEKMTAALHDVVEDTPVTLQDLRAAGFPKAVVDAVDCLTRRKGETYEQFIDRIRPNPLARRAKIADLEDNMNLGRLPNPRKEDYDRLAKYRQYWGELIALDARESGEPASSFKYYAIMHNGEARGLFVYNHTKTRMDMLSWNHRTQSWEHDPRTVGGYFVSDVDAEEVSKAKAGEIARRIGATLPSEAELMQISDQAEARNRADKK